MLFVPFYHLTGVNIMKIEERIYSLLLSLSENEYTHLDTIAENLRLSPRTVRNLIKQAKQLCEANGAAIEHRRNFGIKLNILDSFAFQNMISKSSHSPLPESAKERMEYLIVNLFLNCRSFIKADNLCEELYISKKTLSLSLKDAEQYLLKYQIYVERRPYYGMRILGSEENLRLCLYDMIQSFQSVWLSPILNSFYNFSAIHESINTVTLSSGYSLYENDIKNFVCQVQIMLYRMNMGCFIDNEDTVLSFPFQDKDLEVSKKLAEALNSSFNISFPESELKYLALLLLVRRKSPLLQSTNTLDCELKELTLQMLDSIKNTFHIDFQSDSDLNFVLNQHMISLCARLKYRLKLENPILEEVKENYSFAYAIAAHASTVLAEFFNTIVPEEEIAYLALCFALALKRQGNYLRKRNVLLICSSGTGSAKLFEYRFRELFHDYIDLIYSCDIHNLSSIDFNKIDCAFSTVPIKSPLPIPVCQVQYFFDKHNSADVERILKNKPRTGIKKYFDKRLFFTNIKGKNREQILKNICTKIQDIKELPDGFEENVLKRENLMQTDIFPFVAIPHPYKPITKDTFVSVAILDKPIFWHMYEVQIIFLLSVSTKKENLEDFYHITTKFILDENCIKELLQKKNYDTLIRIISEAEQK